MKKRIAKKPFWILYTISVVVGGSLLMWFHFYSFIATTKRLGEIFDYQNLKCFFQTDSPIYDEAIKEITDGINNIIDQTVNSGRNWSEQLQFISKNFLDNLLDLLIIFLNFGINILFLIYLYFHHNFTTTNLKIKYSLPARIYLFLMAAIALPIKAIKKLLIALFNQIKANRRIIFITGLILLFGSGTLYQIIVETIIFFEVYIYKIFTRETLELLSSFFKYIFAELYSYLKNIPGLVWLMIFLVTFFIRAINKAEHRLKKNHDRLKAFVKDTLTQTTFINGPPGTGKTLLNVSCTLAGEENYIDELEEKMLNYEIKRPKINFAEIRKDPNNFKTFPEYADLLRIVNNRGTFVIANYAIYSPYFKEYCKIFDFNFMRKNLKNDIYPLEEYIVISISELDKEYNSHDDMKKVGADGAATFFSTTSHDLKRHAKIFCDYQLKDQVPLRIRGNSEYFYTIHKRQKKYPFLLYLYYLPVILASKLVRHLIRKYETKKPYINKKTKRKTVSVYKRNDTNLLYLFLRQTAYALDKLADFFDHYWYFRLKGDLSQQDGTIGESKNICLNICDLSIENMALYDSTFLSFAYEEKKNKAFADLARFTSLTPNTAELTICHSQFYNKLNGLEEPAAAIKSSKKMEDSDEYIEVSNPGG